MKVLECPAYAHALSLRPQELSLNNQWFSKIAVWMVIAMVLFTVFKQFDGRATAGAGYIGYSEFLDQVKARQIKSATIQEGAGGTEIVAVTQDDRRVRTTATYLDRGLVGDLIQYDVKFDVLDSKFDVMSLSGNVVLPTTLMCLIFATLPSAMLIASSTRLRSRLTTEVLTETLYLPRL